VPRYRAKEHREEFIIIIIQATKLIMNSVLSLTGAAHRHRRKHSAAEIRAGER
jgi:hypothetical protein